MRVILDTNIVLDVLLNRRPFVHSAAAIFALAETSKIDAFLCATTITTVDYLLTQSLPFPDARKSLWKLLSLFEIAAVNRPVLEQALRSQMKDFEDAVLAQAGLLVGATFIVTRNPKDFTHTPLRVVEPVEFLVLKK